jgi:hypothetical protein
VPAASNPRRTNPNIAESRVQTEHRAHFFADTSQFDTSRSVNVYVTVFPAWVGWQTFLKYRSTLVGTVGSAAAAGYPMYTCGVSHPTPSLQRFGRIHGCNGKSSGRPRGVPLVTRKFASSEHAWDPMASSSSKFCLKTGTVHHKRDGSSSDLQIGVGHPPTYSVWMGFTHSVNR